MIGLNGRACESATDIYIAHALAWGKPTHNNAKRGDEHWFFAVFFSCLAVRCLLLLTFSLVHCVVMRCKRKNNLLLHVPTIACCGDVCVKRRCLHIYMHCILAIVQWLVLPSMPYSTYIYIVQLLHVHNIILSVESQFRVGI